MINVLSGGAVQTFVEPLAASFRGDKVKVDFLPMGRLVKALEEGRKPDVLVVTEAVLAQLKLQGKPIARVGVGVGVREGAPVPDISNADAFKKTLLAAKTVTYMDPNIGTSGKHVAELLARLGIEEEVKKKAKLGKGGAVADFVASGEIELAIHQISEILVVKGVRLVGPLPAGLQKFTVYSAVARTSSPGVAAFIDHLTNAQARGRLAKAGYTSPE
jgi:molybdate transport system substrate-binding protein